MNPAIRVQISVGPEFFPFLMPIIIIFSEKMNQILRLDNADAEDEEQIQVRLIDRIAIRYA